MGLSPERILLPFTHLLILSSMHVPVWVISYVSILFLHTSKSSSYMSSHQDTLTKYGMRVKLKQNVSNCLVDVSCLGSPNLGPQTARHTTQTAKVVNGETRQKHLIHECCREGGRREVVTARALAVRSSAVRQFTISPVENHNQK